MWSMDAYLQGGDAMEKPRDVAKGEYVFRYRLQEEGEKGSPPFYEDRLLELIRQQIANLLNVVVPVYRGKEVKIDGFKLLSDLDSVYEIFPFSATGYKEHER